MTGHHMDTIHQSESQVGSGAQGHNNKGCQWVLEILSEEEHLKIRIFNKNADKQDTLQHYETKTIDHINTDEKCQEIIRLLNTANVRGTLEGKVYEDLKKVRGALSFASHR